MGRRRKKKITYDSGETKAFIGLLFLFAGALAILSYFIDGGVFAFVHSLTVDATFFLGIFLFNVSLHLFHSEFPLARGKSLLGQFMFVVFYSAFLNSLFGGGQAIGAGTATKYGGIVGYNVYSFMRENVFLNFTPVVIIILVIIAVPLSLSMSILDFLDKLGGALQWIWNKLSAGRGNNDEDIQQIPVYNPSTFGDFQKGTIKDGVKTPAKLMHPDEDTSERAKEKIHQPHVEIKEQSMDGAYVNEELQYPDWKLPPTTLLNSYKKKKHSQENIKKNADIIEQTLQSFGVKAKVVDVLIGPTVTQYALDIALGTKVSKISNLANDLALALATSSSAVRIEAPIPGTSYVGIEVPNEDREVVYVRELMEDPKVREHRLNLPLGSVKILTAANW